MALPTSITADTSISSQAAGRADSGSGAIYGSFMSGDFNVGGGGIGGLVGNVSTNGLLMIGLGVAAMAIFFVLWKRRK